MLPRNLLTLRDRKNDWSLADDHEVRHQFRKIRQEARKDCQAFVQLRNVLEEIRSSLASKINDVSDGIKENSLRIANACVQVSNLNNQLSLFAADQFIESRVGDDTSTCAGPTLTSQEVIQNKQSGATDNLRQAVSMGLELMQTHFKRIDIRPEDLDIDDDSMCMPEPIFEPYDENLSRPLPFLIGSSDWNSSSYVNSQEESVKTAKAVEEIVISLPPFTQPKITEFRGLPYSEAADASRILKATSNTKDVEAETSSCSNEYNGMDYTSPSVARISGSQTSLLKEKEVINTPGLTSDSSVNGNSRRYSEISVTPQGSEISLEHPDFEVSHRPPNPEAYAKLQEPEISVKKILAINSVEGQTRRKTSEIASKAVNKLFADSSSDEDDLFGDLKHTNNKAERHISYSNDSQIDAVPQPKSNLQKDADENSLKETNHVFGSGSKTSNTFRNRLDGILANRITSNTVSGVEQYRGDEVEEKVENNGANVVLSFPAKFRSKGPPRRSPSRLLQNSDKNLNMDDARSIRATVIVSTTAEGSQTSEEKVVGRERQDGRLRNDVGRCTAENVNDVKQKSIVSSIFSSDSDDDIFSVLSDKSKPKAFASKIRLGNDDASSLPSSRIRSLNTTASRTQTPKTDFKLKNLFDSDDEDIFTSIISVKEQKQQPARNKEVILEDVVQEAVIPKKDGSVMEEKETVVPKKPNTSKPKRVDIFDDDSDDDLFRW